MSRYKVYPEYKESYVEWLGSVPRNWNSSCLRWYISIASGEGLSNNDFEKQQDETHLYRVIGGNGTLGYSPYLNTTRKAFAIGRVGALCGNVHYINEQSWITDNALKISEWRDFDDKYLFYMLTSARLNEYASKTAQPLITGEQVKSLPVIIPSNVEQIQIANFLDYETAKIDTLIEKQQQLINLLKEKRQAVISHAVTKGLNPDAPMKDSGVEWLGEVPEHWEVKRISLLFNENNLRASTEIELQYPILSVSIHHGISDEEISEEDSDRKLQRSDDRSLYKTVHDNYLAYNMMRAWQGGFGAAKISGLVSPAYVVCKPKTSMNTSYFELVLRTSNAVTELKKYSRGITDFRLRLYWDEFKNIRVPVPNPNEIDKILGYINETNSKYEKLIIVAKYQIKLLEERRTALISAAVTGKIDVRDWKKPGDIT